MFEEIAIVQVREEHTTNTTIRIAGLVQESIVDGPGIRFVLFTQGCPHHCMGCHNPHTHADGGGYDIEVKEALVHIRANCLLDGVTLSGGEPFSQARSVVVLAKAIQKLGLHVITYTGYTYEALLAGSRLKPEWAELLRYTDILIDGKFEWEQRSPLLRFRGSANQRVIDVQRSFLEHTTIITEL